MLKHETRGIGLAFGLIFLYVSPLFILGENAHIRIHDNLDSNIAWYKVLAKSGELFGGMNAIVPQVMNGLPRNAYGTEFSLLVWLHAALPSMTAYAISQAITRIAAFIGMYLLLKTHILKDAKALPIWIGVSLAFALTPFWPSGMLSTLGQPFALWAFLNIRSGQNSWKSWTVLALLPLYSSFVLGFCFFLAAMGILWLRDCFVHKRWNIPFVGAIAMMTFLYMLVDYRFVYSLLVSGEPTSRNEFVSSRLDLWRTVRLIFKNFILGHNHVMTVHTLVIFPLLMIVFYYVLSIRRKRREEKLFLYLFLMNLSLSIWYAFWFNKAWQPLKEKIDVLNTFNFARFHFLRPLVIYVGFALACYIIWQGGRKWKPFVLCCMAAQIAVLFIFNEEIVYRQKYSFKEFYATALFEQIKEYIHEPQSTYRVASIGLHPVIAQYNGFYTLDTYNNFYRLPYKHRFRGIISNELDKSAKLKEYFDTWGGRCYIFSKELGKHYAFRKHSSKSIRHLKLNTEQFKQMGGRFLFSSVPILNASENHLKLDKVFNHPESAWRVYVYEVQ